MSKKSIKKGTSHCDSCAKIKRSLAQDEEDLPESWRNTSQHTVLAISTFIHQHFFKNSMLLMLKLEQNVALLSDAFTITGKDLAANIAIRWSVTEQK